MATLAYREAYSEVIDILNHTRKEDIDKISPQFMEYLRSNAIKGYISKLDHSVPIKDMNLKPKTRDILAIIYRKFWCNEEELKVFDEMLRKNEMRYQTAMKERASNNNFEIKIEQKADIQQEQMSDNSVDIVEYKSTFFNRLINKIKLIFKKK